MNRSIDAWGRLVVPPEDAVELLFRGVDLRRVVITEMTPEIEEYNRACVEHDKTHYVITPAWQPDIPPQQDAIKRQQTWWMPSKYRNLDVRQKLLALCETAAATQRVDLEMTMFEQRGLLPVLRLMCYLVDYWRENQVIWGVGRGSSVASYCLFLIGIHRCDSIKYDLDITEFLR